METHRTSFTDVKTNHYFSLKGLTVGLMLIEDTLHLVSECHKLTVLDAFLLTFVTLQNAFIRVQIIIVM